MKRNPRYTAFHKWVMQARFGFILFIFLAPGQATFTQTITISGQVLQTDTNIPVTGCVLYLSPDGLRTFTNLDGEFKFICSPGTKEITTQVLGYFPSNVKLYTLADTSLTIRLTTSEIELGEVKVMADSVRNIYKSDYGSFVLTSTSIIELPKQFSEPDLIKSFLLLPGVVAGKDGSSDLFVRGGTAGQNVVLANGCILFQPNHLLGFVSAYDIDFIQRSELVKDYFPADLGGGASSVIKLEYKSEQIDTFRIQGRLGLISSSITFQSPIKGENWGISGGFRTGNYSLISNILRRFADDQVGDFLPPNNYNFHNGYIRLNHFSSRWGKFNYLYINGYDKGIEATESSSSRLDTLYVSKNGITSGWETGSHAMQWFPAIAGQTKMRIDLNYNNLSLERDIFSQMDTYLNNNQLLYIQRTSYKFSPDIKNLGTSFVLSNVTHKLKFSTGINFRQRFFSPNIMATDLRNNSERTNTFVDKFSFSEPALFFSGELSLSESVKVKGGIRVSAGLSDELRFAVVEPRLRLALVPPKGLSGHFTFVRLSQYDHAVEASNIGLRSMVWLPITSGFGPEISDVLSMGVQGNISDKYAWSLDAYAKRTTGMLDYKSGASFLVATTLYDLFEPIKGRAYGIEAFLIKKYGKVTGTMSYTYSRSKREWAAPEGLNWIPTSSDRPNNINLSMRYSLKKRVSFGINWTYISGLPATMYIHNALNGKWFDTKNNIRYPDYHRLDLSMRYTWSKKRFRMILETDVYNAYNRLNTYYLQEVHDSGTGTSYFRNVSLFPIMPTVSFRIQY